MTATAMIEDTEQLVAPLPVTTKFVSQRSELRLVKVSRRPIRGQVSGEIEDETVGQVVRFEPYDVVTTDGQKYRAGRYDCPMGGVVVLEDGREVDAVEVLDWLKRHRLNGNRAEGFWLVEQAAPVPTQAELDRIVQAAVNLDEETLARIVEQETAGWARPDVLQVATGGLERVRAAKVGMEEAAREVQAQAQQEAQARIDAAEARAAAAEKKAAAKPEPEPASGEDDAGK